MSNPERRVLIIGADGLRPDRVDPAVMPTYAKVIQSGSYFENFYAAYPPHTRVNMTTLTTGVHPGRHGVVSNLMFVPGAGDNGLIDTSNERHLLGFKKQVGQPVVLVPTLGDRLHRHGKRLAVAASSSAGASLLWNINHPYRILNPASSYGDADLSILLEKLGEVPAEKNRAKLERARWATRALIDVLLDDSGNQVLTLWLSEPDSSQHFYGLGAPEVKEALAVVDTCVAEVLGAIEARGLGDVFDILLISDHGHSSVRAHHSLREHVERAQDELALGFEPVIVGDFIYLPPAVEPPRHDVEAIVAWLRAQAWCDLVMVGDNRYQDIEGTLSLEVAFGPITHTRAPLLAVSPRWTHDTNEHGVPGTVSALTSLAALKSTHGAASPYDLRAFCVGYGPSFRVGVVIDTPCGTVDIAPTVCDLIGLADSTGFDGRGLGDGLVAQQPEARLNKIDSFSPSHSRTSDRSDSEVRVAQEGKTRYFLGTKDTEVVQKLEQVVTTVDQA